MSDRIDALREAGQSPWLDYIRRSFVSSGDLERLVRDGWVTGLTSNPTIFEKAIGDSTDYDQALASLAAGGITDPYEAFVSLAVEDIRAAADLFRPIYDASDAT